MYVYIVFLILFHLLVLINFILFHLLVLIYLIVVNYFKLN